MSKTEKAAPKAKAKAKAEAPQEPRVETPKASTPDASTPGGEMPKAAKAAPRKSLAEEIAEDASQSTLALNPLISLSSSDMIDAARTTLNAIATHPQVAAREWFGFLNEMGRIVTGNSGLAPDPKDKRFADPTWKESSLHRGLLQTYMAWSKAITGVVSQTELDDRNAARARLVTAMYVDALSPSNLLLANPTAMKKAVDTKGASLMAGFRNFLDDMSKNGGLPSQVDASKFKLGQNVATTPGSVVFRNEVLELVQYTATTDTVHRTPLIIVPPQINKYYSSDLSPDKSIIKFLLSIGVQPFCVSWRNPTAAQRDWGLDTYVAALDEAVDAAREITGAAQVNMSGACSGGITLATYLAWLAGKGETKVNGVQVFVCVLDTESGDPDNEFAALVTPETVMAAKQMSAARGVLDGQDMAKMFAWMRPNDLIWNYWINNYLLGNQPPAFDVLFWNADTTRLPARLHGDFLDLIFTNPFVKPGKLSINGVKIDMRKVRHDTYVVGGTTDHITPWKAVYKTARLYGENSTFILSNSGHLQSLLNPPGNPKAWYVKGMATAEDGDAWVPTAKRHEGSWWVDWATWLKPRSGEEIARPTGDGSKTHKVLGAAPGTYVSEP
jgi:polyhydroxyalkanoate synthase